MTETAAPKCPVCGKPRVDAFRPFCSQRCAQVDLGRWFGEDYAVPGERPEDDTPDGERPPE